MSGISMSRMTRSGFSCVIMSSAIRPVAAQPATSISGCATNSSVTILRTTSESSTTSTRIFSMILVLKGSQQRQLGHEHLSSKWLHYVFVRSRTNRPLHLLTLGFGCDHDKLHRIPGAHAANGLNELQTIHHRHVPVNKYQPDLRIFVQLCQTFLAIAGIMHFKSLFAKNLADDHSYGSRVVDHQSLHHGSVLRSVFLGFVVPIMTKVNPPASTPCVAVQRPSLPAHRRNSLYWPPLPLCCVRHERLPSRFVRSHGFPKLPHSRYERFPLWLRFALRPRWRWCSECR